MDINNLEDRQVAQIEFGGKRVIVRDNEEAVIGSVLRGGLSAYQRVKDIVKPEMFGNVSYGYIWNAIEKLYEKGLSIDTITVGDELERAYQLDNVSNGTRSGRGLLTDLRSIGDPRNIESYAENIQDYHVKKMLEEYGKRMVVWSANGRRATDIMHDMNKMLADITIYSSRAVEHVADISQAVSEAYDETDAASNGLIKRTSTGFPDIDRILSGGYQGEQLIIIAARPGQGKTALLLTEALHMMLDNHAVLLFSLEMSRKQIAHRMLSQLSGVDHSRIQEGRMTPEEWQKFTDAVGKLSEMKDLLTIIDLPAIKLGNIRQLVRAEIAKKKYRVIMLDYIQLAEADEKKERRQLEVGSVSRGLKALSKETGLPIVCAAQLSRATEQRADKTPVLSDLREAGDLEQDADIVMFIHKQEDTTRLLVAKNRHGAVGNVDLYFRANNVKFESVSKIQLNG